MTDETMTQPQREAVFLALVEAQDGGMSTGASRQAMAERFAISPVQVRRIEREGIAAEWPPLSRRPEEAPE